MVEALLLLVFVALVVVALYLRNISITLQRWHALWGSQPERASAFHAKELLKATQEVAHYLALDRRDKNERST